jgi:hypothetical protein
LVRGVRFKHRFKFSVFAWIQKSNWKIARAKEEKDANRYARNFLRIRS